MAGGQKEFHQLMPDYISSVLLQDFFEWINDFGSI